MLKDSTPHYRTYADLNTLIDAKADDPKAERSFPAMGIYAGVAGTAVLRPPGAPSNGSGDVTVTLPAGASLAFEFDAIASGTATAVTVVWAR